MQAHDRLRASPRSSAASGDVVAGLVNDGSATAVSRAAVVEAVARRVPVRFVHIVGLTTGVADRSDDSGLFFVALTALRGHSRLRCTFETSTGVVGRALVAASLRASILVVGEDRSEPGAWVARYCLEHARCPVRTVPRLADPGTPVPNHADPGPLVPIQHAWGDLRL